MTHPDWNTLTPMSESPDRRFVAGTWMDREQYDVTDWQLVRTYTTDLGTKGAYWAAPLEGLRRYSLLLQERKNNRIAAAVNRREQDDAWSSHVQSLIEREP